MHISRSNRYVLRNGYCGVSDVGCRCCSGIDVPGGADRPDLPSQINEGDLQSMSQSA